MKNTDLINKIKDLNGLTNEEKSALIDLLRSKKKYGLVWEDKPEDVEEQLRENLPVLREVVEKRILGKDLQNSQNYKSFKNFCSLSSQSKITFESENQENQDNLINQNSNNFPNHILIEGDNLHALTTLTFTHAGKIDVMYFDPPYNTGNKDFKYNDSFVDKEDSYRHSKWLSFMYKRLQIAKRLLSEKGVIFISIDDNEQAQIKLLCDEIFGDLNFIAELPTIMNLKGNQDQFCFAGTHEYSLCYAKQKEYFKPNQFEFDAEDIEEWDEDDIGLFKKGAPLRATGTESNRENRPLMFYPILISKNNDVSTITEEEHQLIYDKKNKTFDDEHLNELINSYKEIGFDIVLPYEDKDSYGRWRWGYNNNTVNRLTYDVIISRTKNGISLYKKQRPDVGELPSKKPKSLFYKPEYSSGNGTAQLKRIFGKKVFNNPKPINLIYDFLKIGSNSNDIILDIFAGSGTTLQATIQLNADDGGNRKCILVTNNEVDEKTQKELEIKGIKKGTIEFETHGICQAITYERNKHVIVGYINDKNDKVAGLTNNNLRYYKTDFVPSAKTEKNRRLLTQLSTELLQIKEDCYNDITLQEGFKRDKCCIFTNDIGKYLIVVYHSRKQHEVTDRLCLWIKKLKTATEKVRVYAFSPESDVLTEDFYEVADKINAVPLPDAIYNAYRATFRTLKFDKKAPASKIKTTEVDVESELFEETQEN